MLEGRRGILGNHLGGLRGVDHIDTYYIYLGYIYSIFTSLRGGLGVNLLLRNSLGVLRAIGHLFGPEAVM